MSSPLSAPPTAHGPSEEAAPARSVALLYVTAQFPSVSLVFEQNELLGLLACGTRLTLLSCRRPADLTPHDFARPLAAHVRYFRRRDAIRGVAWALRSRPRKLAQVTIDTLKGVRERPRRGVKNVAAAVIALAAAPSAEAAGVEWVHADFVQGTAATGYHLATLLDLPWSATAHAFDIYSDDPGKRDGPRTFARRMGSAAFLNVVSSYGRDRLLPQLDVAQLERIHVHRVSVRVDEARPLPLPAGPLHVVGLGRLVQKKGFDVLVRAVALLRDRGTEVRCTLWGDGEEQAALEALCAELHVGDQVRLAGRYEQGALEKIFAEAHALVVPSVIASDGDMDGIPTVIYEAMAFGRPVIVSRLSGLPEVVEDGSTGLIVTANDVEALADALVRMDADRAVATRMGLAARRYVEREHAHRRSAGRLIRRIAEHLDGPGSG